MLRGHDFKTEFARLRGRDVQQITVIGDKVFHSTGVSGCQNEVVVGIAAFAKAGAKVDMCNRATSIQAIREPPNTMIFHAEAEQDFEVFFITGSLTINCSVRWSRQSR